MSRSWSFFPSKLEENGFILKKVEIKHKKSQSLTFKVEERWITNDDEKGTNKNGKNRKKLKNRNEVMEGKKNDLLEINFKGSSQGDNYD